MESKQKKTPYNVVVTSVSVSKPFLDLIKEYNLSPTECFRRGVAVTLADSGISPYANPLNKERWERADEFLKEMQKQEIIKDKLIKLKNILEELNNF